MDIFSHALLPYLIGTSLKQKKEDVTAFVLGGISPDIDVLIMWISFVHPAFFLITHRSITHSLFFGFITAICVLYMASSSGIRSYIRHFIKFEPVVNGRSVAFVCAGAALHVFLDYITTRGVPLLYPLTAARYSGELFFYTDLSLAILSLMMMIYLFMKLQKKNTAVKFLFVFLMIFVLLGSVRTLEKSSAEGFFHGIERKAYPTTNPFDWYVMRSNGEEIEIYEYNGLEKRLHYNETVKRIDVLKPGDGMDRALSTAEELPQVKMFRWRAYAVAVNASFDEETWSFTYYDPVQRAMFKDMPRIFKGAARGFGSVNVTVIGNTAVVK